MSLLSLPPGLKYLANNLLRFSVPPVVAYLVRSVACDLFHVTLSSWTLTAACVLSYPLTLFLVVQWRRFTIARNASALQAELPPQVENKWIGGLDVALVVSRNFEKRFLGDWLFNWSKQYGPVFTRELLWEKRIFTSEPEHMKLILATNFTSFEKGLPFRNQMSSLLGTGVFNSDGDMWRFHRGMTRPFFTKDRISHSDIFDRHVDDVFSQMKGRLQEGYAVDWQDLMLRFTLDSATEFLFGKDVRSLSAGLPYPPPSAPARSDGSPAHPSNRFGSAFKAAQFASLMRARFITTWPLFEFWQDKVKTHRKALDEFVDPILADLLERKKLNSRGKEDSNTGKIGEDETLLEHLVRLTDDQQILKDETLNILIAGRDTTASTLTFAVYKLGQNPKVLQRLREEVMAQVGPVRRPDYDDIRAMKYLRAVINETLRLHPPVPINIRTSTEAVLWPSKSPDKKPYYIPANTRVQYSVFVMHRRKDLWGPDALEFDPNRFLDDRYHEYLAPNPFIFLPFNAGPRICLGQQFAYNEISFMLVRLVQQFHEIELTPWASPASCPPPTFTQSIGCDGKDTAWITAHLTMFVKNGLWLKMSEAPSEEDSA